ncbi:16S rRNA (adenine(1518)-N(6)/adenine(1519)-N(6))-dimethyltransferase RsmA [Mucisphaera sp.]|uniref:16S rRNA (adenine(1518)-N(6)/adenine(1519)-N(6))- dimethyltransferase RsmA n=1 Tax=Mucisphaera sp. TaxID=2913024 RepID=UPI003D1015BD
MSEPERLSIPQQLMRAGLRPKKKLGQNFLLDRNHLLKIVAAAELGDGERVLEVGPGTGVLTEALIGAGSRVVAVEFDGELEGLLRDRFGEDGERFRLIIGDMLDGKHGLNRRMLEVLGEEPFKLVANLPYQIASPLLINLAERMPGMGLGVAMIQKEVADRILAGPGSKAYGVLGILLQVVFEIELISRVPPGCFYPAPAVDSAVIRLRRRAEVAVSDLGSFAGLLHRLFGQRRKQLGSVLGRDRAWPEGVGAAQRPEELSVDDLVRLHRTVVDKPAG